MGKRAKVLIAVGVTLVVVVVGVLVGTRLYGNWVNSNADAVPTLSSTADTGELDGDWSVSEDSFAGYRVNEVLNGQDVTVTGRTEDVSGQISITDATLTAATVEVQLDTVATDESARDDYFRTQALRTEEFPTATFELTEPIEVAAGTEVELVGDLTIRGVTQETTVTAQAAAAGQGLQVVGSAPITFADFGVEAPDLGFVVVEEAGSIEFSLELTAR
ncbi:MAG TPA: YceI family protein [Candidatus Ruania gallistercoris]|uniref:YceI family protein n=1 Tax=Candidatus Ruania gallistercoris TaxID=2838746 RepID=A0A9D2EIV9_9MICO|nr:YceI family protein [Candidatus Ruania gallistercoris]